MSREVLMLADVLARGGLAGDPAYPLRLVSRRVSRVMNATFHTMPKTAEKYPQAPLFMHPDDMAVRGLAAGVMVQVASPVALAAEKEVGGCLVVSSASQVRLMT